MASQLYFAYGSNLNQTDLNLWCQRNGYPEGLLKFMGKVILPDFELAFRYRSASRNGGVLDLKERPGQVVPGVLFEVNAKGWSALDRKEGAPSVYKRIDVTVLDEHGDAIQATSYRVTTERVIDYVKPSEEYLRVVRDGLDFFGIGHSHLNAAYENEPASCPDGFFFYGTLMRREKRFSILQRFGIECVLLAQTFGYLLDLGEFPGLVGAGTEESLVEGEFVRLSDPEKAITTLDAVEGFRGFGKSGSLFCRTRIAVDVGEGRIRDAWAYCLDSGTDHLKPIVSGDWREHRGRRREFLNQLAAKHTSGRENLVAEKLASGLPFCFNSDRSQTMLSLLPLNEALANGVVSERKLAQASGLWTAIP